MRPHLKQPPSSVMLLDVTGMQGGMFARLGGLCLMQKVRYSASSRSAKNCFLPNLLAVLSSALYKSAAVLQNEAALQKVLLIVLASGGLMSPHCLHVFDLQAEARVSRGLTCVLIDGRQRP